MKKQIELWKGISSYMENLGINLCVRTIQYWHKKFPLPIKKIGRKVYISEDALIKWIRKRGLSI